MAVVRRWCEPIWRVDLLPAPIASKDANDQPRVRNSVTTPETLILVIIVVETGAFRAHEMVCLTSIVGEAWLQ